MKTANRFRIIWTIAALFGLLAVSGCGPDAPPPNLELRDAWVRATRPGQNTTAAYGHFENTGGQPVRITHWSSDAYGEVSLHETVIDDGVSRMREHSDVEIAPGTALSLEPGGLHLMLSEPAWLVLPGETVRLAAIASDETRFEFDVEAR